MSEQKNPLALKRDIVIKIPRDGQELIFKMKELSTSDYWSVQQECIEVIKSLDGTVEPRMNIDKKNQMYLSKSITDPPQTMESIANMPTKISSILIRVFNQIHDVDEEDLKKITTQ